MASNTFISKCISGKAKPTDIDFYIEKWHRSNTPEHLYDYLGMTWDEYDRWVQKPDEIDGIIDERRKRKRKSRGAANE